jgi:polyhydroxyalkanoate synthesis regulator phasin
MTDDKKLGLSDIVQKAVYFGVGVANFATQRAGNVFQELRQQSQKLADEMVKRGEMNVDEARRFVEEILNNAQNPVAQSSQSNSSNESPRQIEIVIEGEDEEVDELKKRVQALQKELRDLNNQQ